MSPVRRVLSLLSLALFLPLTGCEAPPPEGPVRVPPGARQAAGGAGAAADTSPAAGAARGARTDTADGSRP